MSGTCAVTVPSPVPVPPTASTQGSPPASRSWQKRWTSWPSFARAAAMLAL